MIKYLISKGGDPFAINKYRINMLHLAAQGDQVVALSFFKNMGINVNARDAKESTPLHWACYAG